MALTAEQKRLRDGKITASFAPYLITGDKDKILNEWLRLVGSDDYVEPDFSDNWSVQLGSYLETFCLDWHEAKTGRRLERRGEVAIHPQHSHISATLDAYESSTKTAIDCKVIGHHRRIDDVCALYLPQLVVQKACAGAERTSLLVVHGGAEPQEYPLVWDRDFEAVVWDRIDKFWQCVCELRPPYEMPAITPPAQPTVEYSFQNNNEWAYHANDWRTHRDSANLFNSATKALKQMVPADAIRCYGHSVQVKRNRAGSLTISETE